MPQIIILMRCASLTGRVFPAFRPCVHFSLDSLPSLSITGRNLMSALGILTVNGDRILYCLQGEIQKTHGTEPAIIFLILMFLYFRHHSGTTLSESLGVTVSLLGIALLWQGKYINKERVALLGLVLATFALNIRPGPMFVLPAFLLWGAWYFRGDKKYSIQFFITGSALIASVFFINNIMISVLAGPNKVAFSNFSWAFMGWYRVEIPGPIFTKCILKYSPWDTRAESRHL
ncbi:MAG: hypothetical protein IPO22_13510 [Anaerolineales bacterium]|nr:hypothetical protein [Anaerolineales bacterium]